MDTTKQLHLCYLEDGCLDFENEDIDCLAHVFVFSLWFVSAIDYLKDQLYLVTAKSYKKAGPKEVGDVFSKELGLHLETLRYYQLFLSSASGKELDTLAKKSNRLADAILNFILGLGTNDKMVFAKTSLGLMKDLFLSEEKAQIGAELNSPHVGVGLYRTFDKLDQLFKLDYGLDHKMKVDTSQKERLYQGGGVGVQSGYSTILLALNHIVISPGDRVVDLGSGYGRVGLACSLLYPESTFIGYEYIEHRVKVSNSAAHSLGLSERLSFVAQDLSEKSFSLPLAEIYYLYDPFTKDTYEYVLSQLAEIGNKKQITIVTKGNAKPWLDELSSQNHWPTPVQIDEGNLCIYRSNG